MAETGPQASDIPAPLPPSAQPNASQQVQQSAQQAQQIVNFNWWYVKLEFVENHKKKQLVNYIKLMIWLTHITFEEVPRFKDFVYHW